MTLPEDIGSIINGIQRSQKEAPDFFQPGLFPGFRKSTLTGLIYNDNNIFNTAMVHTILNRVYPLLDENEQKLCDQITEKAQKAYPDFCKQENGVKVYQFWKVGPNNHFPKSRLLKRWRWFEIPPDADDTSLLFMLQNYNEEEKNKLFVYLCSHANGSRKWANHLPSWKKKYQAFATWLGTGKMPVEFDLVVQCNILRFAYSMNMYDHLKVKETENFILYTLSTGEVQKSPFYSSPNYAQTEVIVYSLAQLIAEFPNSGLSQAKITLLNIIKSERYNSRETVKYILMMIAQYRLEGTKPDRKIVLTDRETKHFSFYIAGMLTGISSKITFNLAHLKIWRYTFHCPALIQAIWLEYQVMVQRG